MKIDEYKDGRNMKLFFNDISNGVFRNRLIDVFGPAANPSRALFSYLIYLRRELNLSVNVPIETTYEQLKEIGRIDKEVVAGLEDIVKRYRDIEGVLTVDDLINITYDLNFFVEKPSSNFVNMFMVDHFGKYPGDFVGIEKNIRENDGKLLKIAISMLIDDMTENMHQMDGARIYLNGKPRTRYIRGENNVYPSSKASIYRPKNGKPVDNIEILLDEIRILQFAKSLQSIPAVANWMMMFGDIEIDSIAQHYGMRTHMMDFSSDMDVALFFACTTWDEKTNSFRPMTKEETKEETDNPRECVIYILPYSVERCLSDVQRHQFITNIGKQPFLRPMLQSGYLLNMGIKESLQTNPYFQIYKFKITEEISKDAFEKMQNGDKIYPKEPFAELAGLANRIKESNLMDPELTKTILKRHHFSEEATNDFYKKATDRGVIFLENEFLTREEIMELQKKVEAFNEGWPKELKEIRVVDKPMFVI